MASGSISKREGKKGVTYRLQVDLGRDPGTRKRRRHVETVKGTEAAAQRCLRELVAQAERGAPVSGSKQLLGAYLAGWLAVKATTVRPTTLEGYQTYVRAYLGGLGNVQLGKLTPAMIQNVYVVLQRPRGEGRRGLSRRTVAHLHRILSEALKDAVRDGLLLANPCARVTPPRPDNVERRILRADEAVKVFDHISQHSPWALIPTMLALYTGMRRSEILALKWEDVRLDAAEPSLQVRRGFTMLTGGEEVVRPPKSAKGSRNLALDEEAVGLLRERRRQMEAAAEIIVAPVAADAWVFADVEGRVYRPYSLSQAFRRACRAHGIPEAVFHGLRHLHATVLLRAGAHPKVVQERLGHSTISTTIDTYSHVMPGLQAAAAKAFAQAFRIRPALPNPDSAPVT
jgi:integrase